MHSSTILITISSPLAAVAMPWPKGGGGFGSAGRGGGYRGGGSYGGGNYRGQSWSGSSFTAGAFAGYLGGVYVGHGPFHGGANGRNHEAEPPADCVVAQTVNAELAPTVDCRYTWEHWHNDNFLFYHIRISPTGQEGAGWAQGIRDNIKGECGSHMKDGINYGRGDAWYWHVNTGYGPDRRIDTSIFHGLEMTVPLHQWTQGRDETECVAEAIRKGSCGVNLDFKNGTCYLMPGTMKAPVQPQKLNEYLQ